MKIRNIMLLLGAIVWSVGSQLLLAQTVPAAVAPVTSATESAPATATTVQATDSTVALLDKAVSASSGNDKAATVQALQSSTEALEKEAATGSGEFKEKLMGQAGNLKKLIPMAKTGMLSGGALQKVVGMVKMALGANRLSSLLGGSSLLGKASALTSNLNLLKGGLSVLGGASQAGGSSLISGALASVAKLDTGGAAAEPAVRNQLGGVLNFAKGLF
jgi:hypothetical protein